VEGVVEQIAVAQRKCFSASMNGSGSTPAISPSARRNRVVENNPINDTVGTRRLNTTTQS